MERLPGGASKMRAIDDYKRLFKRKLNEGADLDKVLELAGEMLVRRDQEIRSEKQAYIFLNEIVKEITDGKNSSTNDVQSSCKTPA